MRKSPDYQEELQNTQRQEEFQRDNNQETYN